MDNLNIDNNELIEEKESVFIKCDGCGSNMVFDPLSQTLKCEYCGNKHEFQKDANVKELEIEQAFLADQSWNSETRAYRCENCGASFVMGSDDVAVACPYCSTSHIVQTEDLTGIKPGAVYPFLIDKSKAVEASKKWARGRIFAPASYKKNLKEENVHGVYMPCFTFDSQTYSVYDGRIGKRKTRTVRRDGKTYTETYIDWRRVSGTYEMFFDDILISAGDIEQSSLNKIGDCARETLCVYEKKFLAGFTASHYTRDIKECWNHAKKEMDQRLRTAILNMYFCDVVDYLNVSTKHRDVTYKYVLLPFYRLNYTFKKKIYPVLVNGNSSRVTGKAPVSPFRVAIAVLLGISLLALFLYLSANQWLK